MNILNRTKCYLAGNMEYTNDSVNWRDYMTSELNKLGVVVLSPLEKNFVVHFDEGEESHVKLKQMREEGRYDEVSEHMSKIVGKDLRLIDVSDFVIVNIEIDKPTFGTIHELVVANQQKKPIFLCVNDKKRCPLWLLGLINHHYIYDDLNVIINILNKIDKGEIVIDSERWRLLNENLR